MEAILSTDRESKTKARILTMIFSILFFIILLLPWFSYQNPPPGQEGTIINLGMLNMGQGDENAPEDEATAATETEVVKEEPAKTKPQKEVKQTKKTEAKPRKSEEVKAPVKEVIREENNEAALALAKKKKAAAKAKKAEEAEKTKAKLAEALELKKKTAAAEAKAAKEAKAKAVAQADAAAKAQAHKDKLKGLFNSDGGGSGEGKGKTGAPGNQGIENGDPNADALKGISSGSGVVSGGLAGRGGSGPSISDNSNKTGVVVIEVCVDPSGNVIKASFTQRGSTTSDKTLVKLAEDNARKWSFKSGMQDKQCGTIKYEFKVK